MAVEVDDPLPFRSISLIHRRTATASPVTELLHSVLAAHTAAAEAAALPSRPG